MTDLQSSYDELRKAAEGATPGAWRAHITRSRYPEIYSDAAPAHTPSPLIARGVIRKADARFIALANPSVVLALVEENEALREALVSIKGQPNDGGERCWSAKDGKWMPIREVASQALSQDKQS